MLEQDGQSTVGPVRDQHSSSKWLWAVLKNSQASPTEKANKRHSSMNSATGFCSEFLSTLLSLRDFNPTV